MPMYTYICKECPLDEFERRVKIESRDAQFCGNGHALERKLDFNGSVYSATANGGMKR